MLFNPVVMGEFKSKKKKVKKSDMHQKPLSKHRQPDIYEEHFVKKRKS